MGLIFDHVNYIYNEGSPEKKQALTDICLQIPDGQFIGLIGHTGSGKSTLVQLMNGLESPSSGTIYYNGADISDKGFDKKGLRARVGLVFQYPEHQLFETDVFKDVCFGPKNLGLSAKETELRAYEALKQVGLEDSFFYVSPFDLSGGQKRRVAIAGVLAMKPELLILDEPTAGLDPRGREEILSLIERLQKDRGITVVLVSHSMEDVANYVDRILVMNRSFLALDGSPREIFGRFEELESMGLAAPEVTYIMRDLRQAGLPVSAEPTRMRQAAEEIYRVMKQRKDQTRC